MALQVWLPLDGDLTNQGLLDPQITNDGAVIDNNGKIGKCYSFNNNKLVLDLSSNITSAIGSLACWVYFNALPTNSSFFNLIQIGTQGGYANCRLGLYMEYTNKINISINGSTTNQNVYTHSLSVNTWYHLCATFDGTIVKLYIDGIEVLSKEATIGSYNTTVSNMFVGGTSSYYLNGKLNDIRYYDHALSAKEIKELSKGLVLHYRLCQEIPSSITGTNDPLYSLMGYDSNIELDCAPAGNHNDGTIIGTITAVADSPRYETCYYFNGIDSAIQVPYNTTAWQTNFTLNLWFKKSELGSKNYETLFGGPSGFEMDSRQSNETTLSLYMASTRGGKVFSPLNFNEWYMITLVNNGINELYYINGELKATIEKKSMPTGDYFIGAWKTATSQNFKGYISDFRIYCTALSADDIMELYHTAAQIDKDGNVYTYEFKEV